MTGDQIALERLLAGCTPDLFRVQGTAIGAAVDEAIDFLLEQGDRGLAIVILSDGSDADSEAVKPRAKEGPVEDIPVYGIFLGDPEREVSMVIDGKEQVMTADRIDTWTSWR